jgi:hypothetical protein
MAKPRKTPRKTANTVRLPSPGEPEVLLDSELVDGSLWLVLANTSDQAAFHVSVDFEGSLMGVGGERDIAQMRVFRELPLLRPKREIRVFVDVARHFYARRRPTHIVGRVSWQSRAGERFSHDFEHDLAIWEDFGEIG